MKSTGAIHLPYLTNIKNLSIEEGHFFYFFKLAEVSPIFKQKDDLDKKNYRPVGVLLHVSKVFERIIYHQIKDFMTDELSEQLIRLRKSHSTQHCLIFMLEIWKKILDQCGYICAIFMEPSSDFDTLNYDLLIAKVGFETDALIYTKSNLMNRKQMVRVNKNFSEEERITGVTQGSILGPLLFSIFLNDLFFVLNSTLSKYIFTHIYLLIYIYYIYINNIYLLILSSAYADDYMLNTLRDNLKKIKPKLRNSFHSKSLLLQNYMGLNAGECPASLEQHRN